jgi:hypothetical protein
MLSNFKLVPFAPEFRKYREMTSFSTAGKSKCTNENKGDAKARRDPGLACSFHPGFSSYAGRIPKPNYRVKVKTII